jgi:hypothetical protein
MCPWSQRVKQDPQFDGSLRMSAQIPPQSKNPAGHSSLPAHPAARARATVMVASMDFIRIYGLLVGTAFLIKISIQVYHLIE